MGVLLFIACRMAVAEQKQRPTTSFLLNVSTSTIRKLTPSPAIAAQYAVFTSIHVHNTHATSSTPEVYGSLREWNQLGEFVHSSTW